MARKRGANTLPMSGFVHSCNHAQPLATIPLGFEDFDEPLTGHDESAAPHYEAVVEVAAVHSVPSVAAAAAAAASGTGTAASGRGRPQAAKNAKKRGAAADADTAPQKRLRAQPHLQVLTRNTIHTPLAYCVVCTATSSTMYCCSSSGSVHSRTPLIS